MVITSQSSLIIALVLLALRAGCSFTPTVHVAVSRRIPWISSNGYQQNHAYATINNKRRRRQQQQAQLLAVSNPLETVPDILSIDDRLHQSLAANDNETIIVEGYVNAKRSFGSSLAFADLLIYSDSSSSSSDTDDSFSNNNNNNVDICQALLRREHYDVDSCNYYDGYRKCLLLGTLLQLEGVAAPTRNPGEAVLLVKRIRILQVPRQPQHIAAIIALAATGDLPMGEVARATLFEPAEGTFEEMLMEQSRRQHKGGTYKTYRSFAKTICSALPPLPKEVEDHMGKQQPPIPTHLVKVPTEISSLLAYAAVNETLSVAAAKEQAATTTTTTSSVVAVMGVVQNRRRFQDNVTIINLVDEITPLSKDTDDVGVVDLRRLESVMHPDILDVADMYGNLLAVGSHIWVSGVLKSATTTSAPVLWITQVRLVRASWRPMTLRYVLDLLFDGDMEPDEAAEALQVTLAEAQEFAEMDDLTARQWKANELSAKLQTATTRMSNLAPEVLEVLDQYEDLREKWPLQPPVMTPVVSAPPPGNTTSSTFLPQSLPGSNWQRKKRPQLEWMVEEICNVARAHPEFGQRTLHILDIGGGKGKLANYLAQSLGPEFVQVHVVDIAAGAIANGAMRAKRLRVENVQYRVADASQSMPGQAMDMVVALHACGHLSDVALAHAVQNDAFGFVICPCCFSSNPFLRVPSKANNADDPQQQQQQSTVEEFLNIDPPRWSALKSVAEVQGDSTLASRGIHTICAVRAEAVSNRLMMSNDKRKATMQIDIKSFPIQYSTRNICLVGSTRMHES